MFRCGSGKSSHFLSSDLSKCQGDWTCLFVPLDSRGKEAPFANDSSGGFVEEPRVERRAVELEADCPTDGMQVVVDRTQGNDEGRHGGVEQCQWNGGGQLAVGGKRVARRVIGLHIARTVLDGEQ